MIGRIPVTQIRPSVDAGRWPAKAIVGETVPVTATVFREGHDAVAATVVATPPATAGNKAVVARMRMLAPGTDRWQADITLPFEGDWTLPGRGLERPDRHLATRRRDQDPARAGRRAGLRGRGPAARTSRQPELPKSARGGVAKAVQALRDTGRSPIDRIAPVLDPDLTELIDRHPLRELVTASEPFVIRVERERAGYSAWYELFPRSVGAVQRPDGSLAERHLRDRRIPTPRDQVDGLRRRLPAPDPPDR